MFRKLLISCLLAVVLSGCGSGNDEPEPITRPIVTPEVLEGYIVGAIDSPISKIHYSTSKGTSGLTDAHGKFLYMAGDTITFSISGIEFPPIPAKEKITPLDFGGEGADLTNTTFLNSIRILQTLDNDGDPENGIMITEEVTVSLSLSGITLDVSSDNFEKEANTLLPGALVDTYIEDVTLVSSEEALRHFIDSLQNQVLGSWIHKEENGGINLLTFLQGNRYLITHSASDNLDQIAGSAEYGMYSWDPITTNFEITKVLEESDMSGGLYDASNPSSSKNLSLSVTDSGELKVLFSEGDKVTFTAVADDDNELIGSWFFNQANAPLDMLGGTILTFLDDANYVVSHTYNNEKYNGDEIIRAASEWNTYSLSGVNALWLGTPSVELDGGAGLYDKSDPDKTIVLSLTNNGDLTLKYPTEDRALARIGSFTTTLRDYDNHSTSALVKRVNHRFSNGYDATYQAGLISYDPSGYYGDIVKDTIDISLLADGTGSMLISTNNETRLISHWSVSNSGVLRIFEADEADAYWKITPLMSKSGEGVIIESLEMDISYTAPVTENSETAFSVADIQASYHVYYDEQTNSAYIATLHFDHANNLVTATDEQEGDMEFHGQFTMQGGGKVIKMLFLEHANSYQYMVHKGFSEELYNICWVDESDDIDYMVNNNIGACNQFLATSEEAAQRAKTLLTPQ
ncbi:hypothetical protein WCN91_10075 [Pseudoalteromonas sp. YIC-827]|uniref:Carboxypeptidase regulatory-like domain-containing protein n=1 Tax=Pseudoalteromonas qingdaonensis TaxID=3131913 RepID=A0ABU9MZK7_9GAMM